MDLYGSGIDHRREVLRGHNIKILKNITTSKMIIHAIRKVQLSAEVGFGLFRNGPDIS